jgi:hypothetical protein
MNFKNYITEVHNKYVDFKIKITGGPFRGDHFGYIPEVKIYKGCILDNCNVQFILNTNTNNITFQNYDSFWFGPEAKLQEQALEAIHGYNPQLILSPDAVKTFDDIINEL